MVHGSMPIAIVTGSGGLIGSESVAHFVERGYDVVGLENDMRAQFFGAEASTAHARRSARRALPTSSIRSSSTSATPTASTRSSPSTRGEIELVIHTAAQPSHDWAAQDPQTDFARQRQRHAEPARGDAPARARRDVHLLLDQQGLRRHAEPAAARGAREAAGAARATTSTTAASTRRCRSTARRTRCSACPRPPPTCWCRSTGATSACPPSASAAAA